jgi:hypothetical protein
MTGTPASWNFLSWTAIASMSLMRRLYFGEPGLASAA